MAGLLNINHLQQLENLQKYNLLSNLNTYKGSEKELFLIIKVLEELNKEKKRIQKIPSVNLPKLEIEKILANIQQKITDLKDPRLSQILRRNGQT